MIYRVNVIKNALPSTKIYLGPLTFGRRTNKLLIAIIELKKNTHGCQCVNQKQSCLVQVGKKVVI